MSGGLVAMWFALACLAEIGVLAAVGLVMFVIPERRRTRTVIRQAEALCRAATAPNHPIHHRRRPRP